MPGPASTKVEVRCGVCQTLFKVKPSEIARGAGRYCSAECRSVARSQKMPGTSTKHRQPPVERVCEVCGTRFMVYPHRATRARPARYCSNTCRLAPPIMKLPRR